MQQGRGLESLTLLLSSSSFPVDSNDDGLEGGLSEGGVSKHGGVKAIVVAVVKALQGGRVLQFMCQSP